MNLKIDEETKKSKEGYSRKSPFEATLLEVIPLNKPGSTKEILHVSLSLEGSNISYQTGSSFGIFPQNPPETVETLLALLQVDKDHVVYDHRSEGSLTIEAFFRKKANLQKITSAHLQLLSKHAPSDKLNEILASKEALLAYIHVNDLLTFVENLWDRKIDVQLLCDVCGPLLPRYYSIASSQKVTPHHVELMVASFHYEHAGKPYKSLTGTYLKERCTPGRSKVSLFLMENPHFCLPKDRETKVILIGPGTGFAALRGFLQERFVQNPHIDGNWLFTGDRHRATDFYYEEELKRWEASGFLKLNLAFSRDQKEKQYVQDEMKKEAKQLWQWLEEGAHIYICGDAKCMAKDVIECLHQIAIAEGGLSLEDASSYFRTLKKQKRLCLDVY